MPNPMTPDAVSDILNEPTIDFGSLDEATEREAMSEFRRLKNEMGDERFLKFGIAFLLELEPMLRLSMSADAEPIQILDEYHRLNG